MAITQLGLTAPETASGRPVEPGETVGSSTGTPTVRSSGGSSGRSTRTPCGARSEVRAARACLRRAGDLIGSVPASQMADLLVELTQLESQVASARMRLLARAEATRVPADSGLPDVGSWAAKATRQDKPTSARQARLARELESAATATGDALAQGTVSEDHCTVIAGALRKLPRRVTTQEKATVERRLLDQASELSPGQLRRVARRALEAIEPDPEMVDQHHDQLLRDEEDAALAKARFRMRDNHDGTTSGFFTVPSFQAGSLRKVIEAMTSPRRARLGAANAHTDGVRRDDPDRFEKLSGLAFTELIEHLPTDHLAKPNVTVLVTMTLSTLREKLAAAGVDNAEDLSAREARRTACGAGLVPAVLGGQSRLLDLGRTQRLFTESQRQALALRHETCSSDGCERPYSWCELHHQQPWHQGGRTDLNQAVPLCWWHHRRIHDPAYHHEGGSDGQIRFTRRC